MECYLKQSFLCRNESISVEEVVLEEKNAVILISIGSLFALLAFSCFLLVFENFRLEAKLKQLSDKERGKVHGKRSSSSQRISDSLYTTL